jgi:hypothetical protein
MVISVAQVFISGSRQEQVTAIPVGVDAPRVGLEQEQFDSFHLIAACLYTEVTMLGRAEVFLMLPHDIAVAVEDGLSVFIFFQHLRCQVQVGLHVGPTRLTYNKAKVRSCVRIWQSALCHPVFDLDVPEVIKGRDAVQQLGMGICPPAKVPLTIPPMANSYTCLKPKVKIILYKCQQYHLK